MLVQVVVAPPPMEGDVLSSSLLLTNLSSGTLKVKFHPFLGLGQADTVIVTGATNNIGLPFVHGGGLIVVRANIFSPPSTLSSMKEY